MLFLLLFVRSNCVWLTFLLMFCDTFLIRLLFRYRALAIENHEMLLKRKKENHWNTISQIAKLIYLDG